jgi:hypothetical protein
MARRRQKQHVETTATRDGLQPAFTSCPQRPPNHVFYCHNEHGRKLVVTFYADYAARKFIDLIVGDDYKFIDRATILGSNGVRVSVTTNPSPGANETIDDVIEYEPRGAERDWEMPEPNATQYATFAMKRPAAENDEPQRKRMTRDGSVATPARAQRIASGGVSIGTIADDMGITASDARAALRKAKMPKPAGGWVFSNDDVDNVRNTIKNNLKRQN